MATRLAIKLSAHFERNLEEIERFLDEADEPLAFEALLTELTDTVLPNLERFPAMGRNFLERPVHSVEVANGAESLAAQLMSLDPHGELREYVMSRYLLLYARIKGTIVLLSIRHHRQLSFDIEALWSAGT
ncbi:MAG: type II toxin-antitoxin system RelE/ParE family toxin [Proteobacteria bacterium]|nr:type II toxin-antitoxin system RelE/ParE family toxin [Pseudomonadota bacterium]